MSEKRQRPVLIIGCPRSGTSALAWSVAQHPRFVTSAESDILHLLLGGGKLRQAYDAAHDRPDVGWMKKWGVGYDEFCAHLGSGLLDMFQSRSGDRRWVDATPGHTLMADELARLFPDGHFLHIVRDGRAVACSMLKSGFNVDWAKDFRQACFTWSHYVNAGLRFEENFPDRVLRVNHSDLLEDPTRAAAGIIEFLEEAPSDAPAAFLAKKRVNSSYDNVDPSDIRKPKDVARLRDKPWEAWSEDEQRRFRELAGETFERAGLSW